MSMMGLPPPRPGESYEEHRARVREEANVSPVWGPSPTPSDDEVRSDVEPTAPPAREDGGLSDTDSDMDSDTDSDGGSRGRKRRRSSKKSKKSKKSSKKSKKSSKRRREGKRAKSKSRKKHGKARRRAPESDSDSEPSSFSPEPAARSMPPPAVPSRPSAGTAGAEAAETKGAQVASVAAGGDSSSDEDIGPTPAKTDADGKPIDYGSHLLPGEGQAMGAFVQQGMRIPRRGEVGWEAEEIEKLEAVGFVMSGSRHSRMNAVRLRKESQVYSAEEKQQLMLLRRQENERKEAEKMAGYKAFLRAKEQESKA